MLIDEYLSTVKLAERQSKKHKPHASITLRKKRRLRKISKKRRRKELQKLNLKLYLENRCIMGENEKLRERLLLLWQENSNLVGQFHHRGLPLPDLHITAS